MHPGLKSLLALLVLSLASTVLYTQTASKPAKESSKNEAFQAAMQKIRDTWVREFNAGHADKVAALYTPDAVLLRRNGSVHTRDSIQAELQRSISSAEAENYTMHSLHVESSGDVGYDTGIYDQTVRHHVAEGNYLMVVKRVAGEWRIAAHAAIPNPRQRY
jgi:ketosteroid isomerase-like protein